jgi:hypothetical protein
VQSSGAATAATITWTSPSTGGTPGVGTFPYTDAPGDVRMMNGFLDAGTASSTITVSGLPAAITSAGYDVYVYAARNNTNSAVRSYELAIGATTLTVSQPGPSPATFPGFTLVPAAGGNGNYVIFRNLTGATFTLTAGPGTGMHGPINGLQIVSPAGS